jgi:CheY-like chemotaxis protein
MGSTKPAPVQIGRALILCVDDNQLGLLLLNEVLVRSGFAVLMASTAEESLEMLRDAPVSLVIADHMLRGSSGTELAAQLKAIKPTVPVVLHSGINPDTVRHVDAFIHKGEPVEAFLSLVSDLVKRFSS